LELGYGFKFGPVRIRPQIGVGNLEISGSSLDSGMPAFAPSETTRNGYFYLEPGLVGLVSFSVVYVGVDANALLLPYGPGESDSSPISPSPPGHSFDVALTVHGQVGVRF
jgi:hypothetical protein